MATPTIIEVLRRFLPDFMATKPTLSSQQHRALGAITHCRTPAMGWQLYACSKCDQHHFAFHSCNHKACPQCGRQATSNWIQRELGKLVGAPYFMVTFTLPEQLRSIFFGPYAKTAYDIFFAAASNSLGQKLTEAKGFKAHIHGFTAVLHTWNQQLLFHPHLHIIVPGAGISSNGKVIQVKQGDYLVKDKKLSAAFREAFRDQLRLADWQVDPAVWSKDWGVHIQPCGTGAQALKYLGAYVNRTAIGDKRILAIHDKSVTFSWKDRNDHNRTKTQTITGVEFVRRYLRHVLPLGLRSIRYYGFCHPAAVKNRMRIRLHTGMHIDLGATSAPTPEKIGYQCPCCNAPMSLRGSVSCLRSSKRSNRGPPEIHLRKLAA